MKKILSMIIAAALIVAVAGCNKNESAETTTTTAAATVAEDTAAEDTADTEAVDEADPSAVDEETVEDDGADVEEAPVQIAEGEAIVDESYINAIAEKAPLYAEYIRAINTIPFTVTLGILDEEGNVASETQLSMAARDKIAMNISQNGAATRIVMSDYNYYIISDETKAIVYYTLDEQTWNDTITASASAAAALNTDALEVTAGTEELYGATYNTEDITDGTTTLKAYYNAETNRAEYMSTNGQTVKVLDYFNGYVEELFNIPEDYTIQEMSAAVE